MHLKKLFNFMLVWKMNRVKHNKENFLNVLHLIRLSLRYLMRKLSVKF